MFKPSVVIDESFAIHRWPKRGKCPKSCFADGSHRLAMIPAYSLLDQGTPGDVCRTFCLECGREFKGINYTGFIVKNQPRSLVKEAADVHR